jgi:hypothetical protein
MSRYRKIEVRLFADPRFRKLSKPGPSGQYLLLWLLTGPVSSILPGVVHGVGVAGLAEMLRWAPQGFADALNEAITLDLVKADLDAPLIFIPLAVEINPPQSINVVKSWHHPWEEIPDCPLKLEIWQALKALVEGKAQAFADEFDRACRMPKLIQEQKQNTGSRIQEQDSCGTTSAPPETLPLSLESESVPEPAIILLPLNDGSEFSVTQKHVDEFRTLYPAVDVMQELRKMRGWLIGNSANRRTARGILRFVTSWLAKEQDKAPRVNAPQGSGSYISPALAPVSMPKTAPVSLPSDLNRNGAKAWPALAELLRKVIDAHSFQTWIKPLKGIGVSKGMLYVNMPMSEFEVVNEKWGEQITGAAESLGLSAVQFVVGGQ